MKMKSATSKISLVLLSVIVMLLPVTVRAQETTLTATVPATHTMRMDLTGNGTVVVDGVAYTQSANIQVQRKSYPTISVNAEDGYEIKSVSLGEIDITSRIHNGTFTLPEMCDDVELIVKFETQISPPQTGDTSGIEILNLLMLLSVIGMLLCVIAHRKTRTTAA